MRCHRWNNCFHWRKGVKRDLGISSPAPSLFLNPETSHSSTAGRFCWLTVTSADSRDLQVYLWAKDAETPSAFPGLSESPHQTGSPEAHGSGNFWLCLHCPPLTGLQRLVLGVDQSGTSRIFPLEKSAWGLKGCSTAGTRRQPSWLSIWAPPTTGEVTVPW